MPIHQENNLFKPQVNSFGYDCGKHSFGNDCGKQLGLFISKQIVEKLNGSISYQSTEDNEGIFEFTVPCKSV